MVMIRDNRLDTVVLVLWLFHRVVADVAVVGIDGCVFRFQRAVHLLEIGHGIKIR